jgi:tetratricopeptide (TPR) repeat protein
MAEREKAKMFSFFRSQPKDLRSLVFKTVAGPNRADAVALCKQRHADIWAEWPSWAQHLMQLQARPTEAKSYADSLRAVAEIFNQELKDPRFMRLFGDVPEDNPTDKLYERLGQARSLTQQLKLEHALKATLMVLEDAQGEGTELFELRAFAIGDMAQLYFFRREFEEAERAVKLAWTMCRELRDLEGMENHREGLFELLRYLDRRAEARELALEQAQFLQSLKLSEAASAWQKRADTVVGEPLLRVQAYFHDQCYELEQLPLRQDGSLHIAFRRNRITLFPAQVSTKAGRALAEKGQIAEARKQFQQAQDADRYDPESRMLLGLLFMDEGNYTEAVAQWEECERLAPGYFHVRSDLWFARQLADGKMPRSHWQIWRQLEDGHLEPLQKLELAGKLPLAEGTYHKGQALQQLGRKPEAKACFEAALAQAPEPHLRTRILLQLGGLDGDREVLQQAIDTNGCLVSAAMARWLLQPS